MWHGHSVWSCIHSSNLLRRGVWLPAVNNLCRSFLSSVVLLSVTYFPFIRSLSRCILFLTLVASPSLFTRLRQCFYKCLRITTKSRLTRLTAITELTVHESSQVQQTEGWQTLAPRARFASAANKRSRVCPGTACVVFTHWQTLCAYMTSSTILEVHDIQHCHQRRTEPRPRIIRIGLQKISWSSNVWFLLRYGAKYCDKRVCMSVCLFVCLSTSLRLQNRSH